MLMVKNAKQSFEGAEADTAAGRDDANTSICVLYGHFLHNPASAERINVTHTHTPLLSELSERDLNPSLTARTLVQ